MLIKKMLPLAITATLLASLLIPGGAAQAAWAAYPATTYFTLKIVKIQVHASGAAQVWTEANADLALCGGGGNSAHRIHLGTPWEPVSAAILSAAYRALDKGTAVYIGVVRTGPETNAACVMDILRAPL